MSLLAIDLGGTKLAAAVLTAEGDMVASEKTLLLERSDKEVGRLITGKIRELLDKMSQKDAIRSIGISVPGIYRSGTGTVWAPNIPGWTDYPLLKEVKSISGDVPVMIDSDRACYILGELWKGNAIGCKDAIYLSVGTGIGAGILVNGTILRGANDIAGAIGWMALKPPFDNRYTSCGCFEYHASGEGLARVAQQYLEEKSCTSILSQKKDGITARDVFAAFEMGDPLGERVVGQAVEFWGMAVANLVSLFNPEKILLGGGVFGPALSLMALIRDEAKKWAQPVSIHQYSLEAAALGGEAGVYGAGLLALQHMLPPVELS